MLFSLVVPIVCSPVCLGVVRLSVPGNEEQNTQIQNFTLTKRIYINVILYHYIYAVLEGFKAVSKLEFRNGGRKIANKLAVYIDNLQAQHLIASIVKEIDGSSLLASLAMNHSRIRQYVRDIKEEVSKYTSVTFSWTRSHTTSNSFIALGNKEADKLAKQGLAVALAND